MATDKSKTIGFRFRQDEVDSLDAYVEEHGLSSRMQAIRIAIQRLLTKKPTGKEVRDSTREIGNPLMLEGGKEASKLGEKGARKRHHGEE